MARTDTLGHFLTDVADAIRSKTGSEETIQASDFDTEIENIPSGSSQPKTIDELNEAIANVVTSFNEYLDTIPNQYEGYVDDAITLYTPNENFKNYWIRLRTNGKYQIIWFANCMYLRDYSYGGLNASTISLARCKYNDVQTSLEGFKMNSIEYNQLSNYANRSDYNSIPSDLQRTYASGDYDTLNDCIASIQNNSAEYTNLFATEYGCTKFLDGLTNMVFVTSVGTPQKDKVLFPTRISSNETIVAIE